MPLTDEEIICSFCETKPDERPPFRSSYSLLGWWWKKPNLEPHEPYVWATCFDNPKEEICHLGWVREIEERLNGNQRSEYDEALKGLLMGDPYGEYAWHIPAAQKITAALAKDSEESDSKCSK